MVDFISGYPGVDAQRVGALGICGGGGYTIQAVKTDKRIKAVATVSMFNSGRVRRNGFLDAQVDTIAERLEQAAQARAKELTGQVEYTGTHISQRLKLTQEQLEDIPAGKDADTRYMTDAVFDRATGVSHKERFLIDGATHIETYWKEPYVTQEADKLIEFFERYL